MVFGDHFSPFRFFRHHDDMISLIHNPISCDPLRRLFSFYSCKGEQLGQEYKRGKTHLQNFPLEICIL